MGRTLSVVCIQCLSVLEASAGGLQVLQKFQAKERIRPLIPLGTRGKVRGDLYEIIGFQVRTMTVEGTDYSWREYVLFNPYKGFRYLTEYNGHWNDVNVVHSVPTTSFSGSKPAAKLLNETYKHFQHYYAKTTYVMGEFPWKVMVGESANCDDFVSPPRILSREVQDQDVNWSVGEYLDKATIERNFGLKEKLPDPVGVFANQPSPMAGRPRQAWSRFLVWSAALLAIQMFFVVFHSRTKVLEHRYDFSSSARGEQSFVTEPFDLKGRTSNVEVDVRTNLDNEWAYFNLALIHVDNGQALEFGRNISYYHGRDSDGNWTEGNSRDTVVVSSVPPGRYYLRVEPEMDTAALAPRAVNYTITVRRDVTTWGFFLIGVILLLIPAIVTSVRGVAFESKRWAESDYAPSSSGGNDD